MEKVIKVNNLEETIALGNRLGLLLQPKYAIDFKWRLRSREDNLTKGIIKIRITKVINSPTFTILKQYQGRLNLSHFDAYRLEGQDDDLGFEEIFDSDDVCVVEWANFIEDILPVDRLTIEIKN